MGHIYVLCGPPGAGKTSLLKAVAERSTNIKQLKRLTTREPRKEEGDEENTSLEYDFLQLEEFAERISKEDMASLIEWNGNYYATQISELNKSFNTEEDSILLEDIPSALSLKNQFKDNVTIVFLFTANKDVGRMGASVLFLYFFAIITLFLRSGTLKFKNKYLIT